MAKFELNDKLRVNFEKWLEEIDLSKIDVDFKDKLESYLINDEQYIEFEDIKKFQKLFNQNNNKGRKLYVHEIIAGSNLYLPKYEAPPRNPELEARIQALKARFENQEYQEMVKNVDLSSPLRHKNTFASKAISTDFKTAQGQLIAIVNMVVVILGAFAFGYKSVEYSLDKPNYMWQITAGFVLALIVAIADIYFLFKKLLHVEKLEDESVKETNIKKIKRAVKTKPKEKLN